MNAGEAGNEMHGRRKPDHAAVHVICLERGGGSRNGCRRTLRQLTLAGPGREPWAPTLLQHLAAAVARDARQTRQLDPTDGRRLGDAREVRDP